MGYVDHKEQEITEDHVSCENHVHGNCRNSWGYCKVNDAAKELIANGKCDQCGGNYIQHTITYTQHWKEYICDCGKPGEEYRDRYGYYAGIYCSDKCAKASGLNLDYTFDESYAGEHLDDY